MLQLKWNPVRPLTIQLAPYLNLIANHVSITSFASSSYLADPPPHRLARGRERRRQDDATLEVRDERDRVGHALVPARFAPGRLADLLAVGHRVVACGGRRQVGLVEMGRGLHAGPERSTRHAKMRSRGHEQSYGQRNARQYRGRREDGILRLVGTWGDNGKMRG